MKTKTPLFLALLTTALIGSPALATDSVAAPAAKTGAVRMAKVPGADRPAAVLRQVMPTYPRELGELCIQGSATVEMSVDAFGRVSAVRLLSASEPEFGERALAAAKHWTFTPAVVQGRPVATRVNVPFNFTLPQLASMDGL